jgi:Zn-finger nucleic acid-binding protein
MKCPVEGTPLVMSERQGVEIDHCPHCRGVWLDRGELDKIIERSAPRGDPGDARKKRPGSFLDDIFDF